MISTATPTRGVGQAESAILAEGADGEGGTECSRHGHAWQCSSPERSCRSLTGTFTTECEEENVPAKVPGRKLSRRDEPVVDRLVPRRHSSWAKAACKTLASCGRRPPFVVEQRTDLSCDRVWLPTRHDGNVVAEQLMELQAAGVVRADYRSPARQGLKRDGRARLQ